MSSAQEHIISVWCTVWHMQRNYSLDNWRNKYVTIAVMCEITLYLIENICTCQDEIEYRKNIFRYLICLITLNIVCHVCLYIVIFECFPLDLWFALLAQGLQGGRGNDDADTFNNLLLMELQIYLLKTNYY